MKIQLCVSGNLGSGKTTLSRTLCRDLGFAILKQRLSDPTYLTDFVSSQSRWAFEVQLSFLTHKTAAITSATSKGQDVVIDGSLYEDIEVFTKHFYKKRLISKRSFNTYQQAATLAQKSVPPPTMLIFCKCSAKECEKRITARGPRADERLYPRNHIAQLEETYNEWLNDFNLCPVFLLDTERFDLRDKKTRKLVSKDVITILENGLPQDGVYQLPLFSELIQPEISETLNYLSLFKRSKGLSPSRERFRSKKGIIIPTTPYVYIAAPFTGATTTQIRNDTLFQIQGRGEIKLGLYRDTLLAIERAFKSYNLETVVPHRDDSGWGKKPLKPQQLVNWCSVQVQHCAVICALPGHSAGVHYEPGLARAWNKPSIILENGEVPDSIISVGLQDPSDTLRLRYHDISEIPKLLRSSECSEFLNRMGLL